MHDTLCHVVGDCFAEFSKNKNVILVSDLVRALQCDRGAAFGDDVRFVPGQGLQPALLEVLFEEVERAGRTHLFCRWTRGERANGPLSHKRRGENTMITTPTKVADDHFEAELCLDERDDLIADHITGQHLPGMILVEAARQMFIAAFERHFNESGDKVSFLVNEMNNTFHQFAFPVATELRMKIHEKRLTDRSKLYFYETTRILQAGKCLFEQTGRITICRHQTTSVLEVRAARHVLNALQAAVVNADRIAS